MTLSGGCLCGAVRYRAEGPVQHETVCHCTLCRRASGAPLVAWFTVPLATLGITGGLTAFRSSSHGTRQFCPACGSQITFKDDDLTDLIDLTTASLDDPAVVPPRDQTWLDSALPWTAGLPSLPGHKQSRPD